MHLTIFAAGSRGDVQPCLVLGKALQRAGFQVTLAAPQNFADFVQAEGLFFHPLCGDVQQIMAGETGRDFMETGNTNPIRSIHNMRKMVGQIAIQMMEDVLEASQNADALITLAVFEPGGAWVPEEINARAEEYSDGFILNGEKSFVPDGQNADLLIGAFKLNDKTALFLLEPDVYAQLEPTSEKLMDETRRSSRIVF